jgi:hypothetical protein
MDEARGFVRILGISTGRIAWPIGTRGGRGRSLVVYEGLARAVRSESNQAVCHLWGVTPQTVTKWRKLLGVGPVNPGTSHIRRLHFLEPWGHAARAKSRAKNGDPARCAKIAASKRGKPRPRHVIEAMIAGRLAKPVSAETRRRMSEACRRRGARPPKAGRPWPASEDELVRRHPPARVVELTGRTLSAVYTRRRLLGINDGRTARHREPS